MSISVNAFLTLALSEIRAVSAGDVVSAEDMDLALAMFNELLDFLNINGRAIYANGFHTFTLTPSLQPHTIGIAANTPTFSVSVARPSSILKANQILTGNIRVPLTILDEDGWNTIIAGAAAGQTPTILASVDTYLYYSADWPNGSLYLWPVPTVAYGLELLYSTLLASVALSDTFDLPPGYQTALRLTVAEKCAAHMGLDVSPRTAQMAINARTMVWGANDVIPDLRTRDGGIPGGDGGWWDYRTGTIQ